MNNYIEIKLPALSKNEALARSIIAAFCVELNPTIDDIDDIKTAVSEAVTNCIVHAYGKNDGDIYIRATIIDGVLTVEIKDFGIGIADISEARKPFFTTRPNEERSGMGFTVMETFMDTLEVKTNENGGTTVIMSKKI